VLLDSPVHYLEERLVLCRWLFRVFCFGCDNDSARPVDTAGVRRSYAETVEPRRDHGSPARPPGHPKVQHESNAPWRLPVPPHRGKKCARHVAGFVTTPPERSGVARLPPWQVASYRATRDAASWSASVHRAPRGRGTGTPARLGQPETAQGACTCEPPGAGRLPCQWPPPARRRVESPGAALANNGTSGTGPRKRVDGCDHATTPPRVRGHRR
jgi:hypothetical protein